MRTIAIMVCLLFARIALAATPVTCTALKALGYNYLFFTFTGSGSGPDVFTIAHSNDGQNWTNLGGSWAACGNGSPCGVNSPSAACINDHVYLLIAETNDANLNSTKQDIGVLNDDYSVTTLLTFDWASLGSVQTIFAGRWNKVTGSTNCFVTPVNFTGGTNYVTFANYAACATLTPTSASIASGPTAITLSGSTNGMYDPQVIASPPNQTSTCTLVGTETVPGFTYRVTALATGACPNGPFTWQTNGTIPGSPLAAVYTQDSQIEGPNYIQTTIAGGYYFFAEGLFGFMRSSSCTPVPVLSCVVPTPILFTEDQTYRAGTVLSFATLPATTYMGATIIGGTHQ